VVSSFESDMSLALGRQSCLGVYEAEAADMRITYDEFNALTGFVDRIYSAKVTPVSIFMTLVCREISAKTFRGSLSIEEKAKFARECVNSIDAFCKRPEVAYLRLNDRDDDIVAQQVPSWIQVQRLITIFRFESVKILVNRPLVVNFIRGNHSLLETVTAAKDAAIRIINCCNLYKEDIIAKWSYNVTHLLTSSILLTLWTVHYAKQGPEAAQCQESVATAYEIIQRVDAGIADNVRRILQRIAQSEDRSDERRTRTQDGMFPELTLDSATNFNDGLNDLASIDLSMIEWDKMLADTALENFEINV